MKLGFACAWDAKPELTWSHTPWSLREALRSREDTEVVDLGVTYPPALRSALKAGNARRHDGRWVSMWRHSRPARQYGESVIRNALKRTPVDAVLQIQDLAAVPAPFLLYQDLSYDVLLEAAQTPDGLVHFPSLSGDAVHRLRDRQRAIYEQASGVLAMSEWFASHLITVTGLPASKVHVVHPGATAAQHLDPLRLASSHARRLAGPRRRLLFVGKDFRTKAGEQVVAALALLRSQLDPAMTLTVAGPDVWPLPGAVPDGVTFLGRVPVSEVGALYDSHDLFVLPSRFEGFGISFVEALAHGLPCVGRAAFAMTEIVTPGVNGALVTSDAPADLAAVIASCLADDSLYAKTHTAAPSVSAHYSWSRAAKDVISYAALIS